MLIFFKSTFFLGGIVPLFLGLFIYLKNRNNTLTRTYFGMSTCCAVWSLGFFMLISSDSLPAAVFWRWFMESGSIFIVAFWIHFINILSGTFTENRIKVIFFYALSSFLWLVNLGDLFGLKWFASEIVPKGGFDYYPTASFGYYIYFLFFFLSASYSIYLLFRNINDENRLLSYQSKYLITASVLGFCGGGMTFLLTLNIIVIPYGVIFFSFYPIAIAYTVAKYKLFDIKVVATQLLVSTLSILILVRTIVAESIQEQFINGLLFIVITTVGIFLAKSVIKEVTQREKIEKLAKDLEEANERLKELDQLKSEFVSLATHQIRGPLAAIKGYSSLMLEGDFGEIPKNLQSPIETVFNSSKSLAVIVDDFLNVSRIEQGKMKYDFTDFDLCELVSEVTNEQKPNLEKKNLTLSTGICQEPILIHGDRGKIKQIVGNIIDNSIKYTLKGGISVTMEQFQSRKKVRLIVKDTGVGIRPETIPHLFQKFSRAEDASKVNILGTGLGLYVAKEMVKAHDGKIWVESDGEGKGSTFFIELNTK